MVMLYWWRWAFSDSRPLPASIDLEAVFMLTLLLLLLLMVKQLLLVIMIMEMFMAMMRMVRLLLLWWWWFWLFVTCGRSDSDVIHEGQPESLGTKLVLQLIIYYCDHPCLLTPRSSNNFSPHFFGIFEQWQWSSSLHVRATYWSWSGPGALKSDVD